MRARWISAAAIAATLVSCAPYSEMGGRTYMGFTLGIESAPPPPRVRIVEGYRRDPVPGTDVIVVDDPGADCDVFQYGGSYYMYSSGYWYRAPRPDETFVAIDVRRVPNPVLNVPEDRWRHHPHGGPPGQRKHGDHDRGRDHEDDRHD